MRHDEMEPLRKPCPGGKLYTPYPAKLIEFWLFSIQDRTICDTWTSLSVYRPPGWQEQSFLLGCTEHQTGIKVAGHTTLEPLLETWPNFRKPRIRLIIMISKKLRATGARKAATARNRSCAKGRGPSDGVCTPSANWNVLPFQYSSSFCRFLRRTYQLGTGDEVF